MGSTDIMLNKILKNFFVEEKFPDGSLNLIDRIEGKQTYDCLKLY